MKKKILSQLMILSFAFAGLFLVGNNVFAEQEQTGELITGYSCTVTVVCSDGGSVSCTGIDKIQGCQRNADSGYVVCDGATTWC